MRLGFGQLWEPLKEADKCEWDRIMGNRMVEDQHPHDSVPHDFVHNKPTSIIDRTCWAGRGPGASGWETLLWLGVQRVSRPLGPPRRDYFSSRSVMFLNRTTIGGPRCNCNAMTPLAADLPDCSSITSAVSAPLMKCCRRLPWATTR